VRSESLNYRLAFGALLLVSIFLCFVRLDAGGLRNGDEARYAIVAENILHTGDWATLHYLDAPYFQKSPARFWLSAALFRVAGSNAFTVRFWSALFGVGAVMMTVLVGRRLYGRWAGLLAGFILATTPAFLFVHGARTGEMDSAVTFWWLLALLPLLGSELRPRDVLLSLAAAAAAGMFKHLAYTPVILMNVGLIILARGGWRVLNLRTVLGGVGVLLVILAPWYLVERALHGDLFWRVIWGRVVTGPAFQVAEASATYGRAFYLGVLGAGAWPWSLLVPPALVSLVVALRRRDQWRQWVPWLMLGVLFLFITVSERKLSWYAIPGYAAIALLGAGVAGHLVHGRWRGIGTLWILAAGAVALVIGPTASTFIQGPAYQVPLNWQFLQSSGSISGLIWVPFALAAGLVIWGRMRTTVLLLASVALALASFQNVLIPAVHVGEPPALAVLADEVGTQLGPEHAVVLGILGDGGRDDVTLYYLKKLANEGTPAVVLSPVEAGRAAIDPGFHGVVVLSRQSHQMLSRRLTVLRQLPVLGSTARYVVLDTRD